MESLTSMLTRLHKMEKDISETQYSKRFEGKCHKLKFGLSGFLAVIIMSQRRKSPA